MASKAHSIVPEQAGFADASIATALTPPHVGVYTRIRPSMLHQGGVGVFAIQDITKGTYVFEPDDDEIVWVDQDEIANLPTELQRLYKDFAVKRKGLYGCPANFNRLTISWFLNHSESPNIGCDDEYKFYALRDIKNGEELTSDYSTYSDDRSFS